MPAQKATKATKATPQAREAAEVDTVTFTYDGDDYTAPASPDLDVVELIDARRLTSGARALLGEDQYARFRERHSTMAELDDLFSAYAKAVGLGN